MTYELAAMLKEQVLPVLDESGAKTIFVTCGNDSQAEAWYKHSGYPKERAFLDQQGVFYNGLKTHRGAFRTLGPALWLIGPLRRLWHGNFMYLVRACFGYKLTVPEGDRGWLQGGVFIFEGRKLLWSYYASTPEDHPDFKTVVTVAKDALAKRSSQQAAQ